MMQLSTKQKANGLHRKPVFTDLCPSQWEFKHNQYRRMQCERFALSATAAAYTLPEKELN